MTMKLICERKKDHDDWLILMTQNENLIPIQLKMGICRLHRKFISANHSNALDLFHHVSIVDGFLQVFLVLILN